MCTIDRMPSPLIEAFNNTPNSTQNNARTTTLSELSRIENILDTTILKDAFSEQNIQASMRNLPQNASEAQVVVDSIITQRQASLSSFREQVVNPLNTIKNSVNQSTNVKDSRP